MSSILTNNSAMSALSTLRNINKGLNETQDRISSGLKVSSAKDNAAYFSISETMKGDSGMTKAISDGLTLAKNTVSTGRLAADTINGLVKEFGERVAAASQPGVDTAKIQEELTALVGRMDTALNQSSFNGTSVVITGADDAANKALAYAAPAETVRVTTGISRSATTVVSTGMDVDKVNLWAIRNALEAVDVTDNTTQAATDTDLATVETASQAAISASTSLGIAEASIESQQDFLNELSNRFDSGIGALVDANMEEEAARLQALQVQQQLSSQALSIANQAPQNILSLFR